MRVVYMGTGEIGIPSFQWLVQKGAPVEVVGLFTQPDKKIGRKQILTPPEIKQLAAVEEIPVFQPEKLRGDQESIEALTELAPDLIVVMAYGQILPRYVLESPRLACVNLHTSLLPRHRGASPIQAAIREGDAETGVTLMHVAPKLDSGDMIRKEVIPIEKSDTGGTLHDKLALLGPILLGKYLDDLAANTAKREPQNEEEVTYAAKLSRDDGEIDWSRNATEIERLIRAYDPWPGTCTTFLTGERRLKLKIFPHSRVSTNGEGKAPGTILDDESSLKVQCGEDSVLELEGEVQFEGKKRLTVKEFLRGYRMEPGTLLGN